MDSGKPVTRQNGYFSFKRLLGTDRLKFASTANI